VEVSLMGTPKELPGDFFDLQLSTGNIPSFQQEMLDVLAVRRLWDQMHEQPKQLKHSS
jgi:hypothetical protein